MTFHQYPISYDKIYYEISYISYQTAYDRLLKFQIERRDLY